MQPVATWRRPAICAIAAALLGLLGAAGCTMIGESLSGVSLSRQEVGQCIADCATSAQDQTQSEQQTHQENVDRCLELPEQDRGACLDAEGARHAAAVQEIAEDLRECQDGCHHQGSGIAG